MDDIKIVKEEVTKLLDFDNSGHGMDHINRVVNIAEGIANKENVNTKLVIITALLHDADDYKLFGYDNAGNLTNTKMILNKTKLTDEEKNIVINSIKTIGYSKRLEGTIPELREAKIVSDADMLDGMGAVGILRSHQYNIDHDSPFFDRNIFPTLNMDAETYRKSKGTSVVNHVFEKILKLKDLMLTETGHEEAVKRYNFIIEFLREYFYEENAEEWMDYLNKYINK